MNGLVYGGFLAGPQQALMRGLFSEMQTLQVRHQHPHSIPSNGEHFNCLLTHLVQPCFQTVIFRRPCVCWEYHPPCFDPSWPCCALCPALLQPALPCNDRPHPAPPYPAPPRPTLPCPAPTQHYDLLCCMHCRSMCTTRPFRTAPQTFLQSCCSWRALCSATTPGS